MASPAVAATTEGGLTATGTSLAVTLPGSGSASDLYIVIIAKGSGSNTINALTDWTELLDENQAAGLAILYYSGAGVPSNPTFTQSATSRSVWGAYRITGADKTTTLPQVGTTATGTSTTPDPPSVTVTGGPKDILAIACFVGGGAVELADDDTLVTTFPTNYTDGQIEKTGGTTGTNLAGLLGSAARQVTAASSENPGTFTQNASRAWRAQTIVVHPAGPITVAGNVAAETDSAPAGTVDQEAGAFDPPLFIQEAESAFNSSASTQVTPSFTVQAGDVVVNLAAVTNGLSTLDGATTTISGLTFTEPEDIGLDTNTGRVSINAGTAGSSGTGTVSVNVSTAANMHGHNALTFRGSDGIGASEGNYQASSGGTVSLPITTTQDNSAIALVITDWDAGDLSAPTWRQVNSADATILTAYRDAAQYSVLIAYYADAGVAGAKTVGISAPTGRFAYAAIEILGTASEGAEPITVNGGVASETDTAPAGTLSQPQTPTSGEVAPETDTAPAGTIQLGTETTVSGEVAPEADAAPAGTIQQPQTPVAGGVAGETDTAPAGTVVTETGGATQAAYTATKTAAASQTGPSYTITPDGANAPAIVTALSIVTVAGAPTTIAGGVASETDTAPAGTPITGAAQTVAGGVASEDDTAPAGTATVVAGGLSQAAYTADKETPASQTGPSYTITPDGSAAPAIVTALSIRSVPATVVSGGVASETDTAPAGALLAAQTIAGGVAQEADSAPTAAISTWPVIGPFIGSELGYVPPGGLAEIVAVEPAVRTLGDPTVTTTGIARPTGQANTRALGDPTITGRHLQPAGQAHTRGQGTPTLSARTLPAGQAHTRSQGTPSVNVRTLTPTALTHTRAQGTPTVSSQGVARPAALTHTARALGTPTATGRHLQPASQTHTRAQGTPTLSARALPAGLTHTRELGDTAVDVRTLQPLALDRA